jgi:hypothetical protein
MAQNYSYCSEANYEVCWIASTNGITYRTAIHSLIIFLLLFLTKNKVNKSLSSCVTLSTFTAFFRQSTAALSTAALSTAALSTADSRQIVNAPFRFAWKPLDARFEKPTRKLWNRRLDFFSWIFRRAGQIVILQMLMCVLQFLNRYRTV